jgi:histidine ammonia-lyase
MPHTKIGDTPVSLGTVLRAGRGEITISLSANARARIAVAREVVEKHAEGEAPVYGVNTGLGGNVGHRLKPGEIEDFQVQIIRGRCIGMGKPFPPEISRAMLFCRIVGMARGGAGVSPELVDHAVNVFNAGIAPVVPGRGSIGAGDLGLCAHLGAAVMGLGDAYLNGERLPGTEALARAGLTPPRLGPKDGLGLINASVVSCGYGATVLGQLADLLTVAAATAALSMEGYAANPRIFDPHLAVARPARGQAVAATMFRALLAGSWLNEPGAARSIQDALSFRVLAQIWGTALDAVQTAVEAVETEVNAAADNPLVLAESAEILSTANFHTPAIALAFDMLAIVLTQLASASAQRIIKLMDARLSGLPKYLSPLGGSANGFNSMQKTAAALYAEIRLRATPASLDAIPVSETVEDHAPQTPLTIRKLEEQLLPLRMLIAIEAMVAAQAVDLRSMPHLSDATSVLHRAVRSRVPALKEDRELGPEADGICAALADRALAAQLRTHLHGLGLPAGIGDGYRVRPGREF